MISTGGTAAVVKVWDLMQQKLVQKFTVRLELMSLFAIIFFFNTVSFVFQGHTDAITCLSFDHSDEYIASGSSSGDILIHSREKMTVTKLRGASPSVR